MSTRAGTSEALEIGIERVDGAGAGGMVGGGRSGSSHGHHRMGGFRPWFRLFLGISGTALAISLALGLVVLLTTTAAHAQPPTDAARATTVSAARR